MTRCTAGVIAAASRAPKLYRVRSVFVASLLGKSRPVATERLETLRIAPTERHVHNMHYFICTERPTTLHPRPKAILALQRPFTAHRQI